MVHAEACRSALTVYNASSNDAAANASLLPHGVRYNERVAAEITAQTMKVHLDRRLLALISTSLSTSAIVVCVLAVPLIVHQLQQLSAYVQHDLQYCRVSSCCECCSRKIKSPHKVRSRHLWSHLVDIHAQSGGNAAQLAGAIVKHRDVHERITRETFESVSCHSLSNVFN